MKRTFPIGLIAVFFFYLLLFTSCGEKPVQNTKEKWAVVVNFLSPDSNYYPPMRNFPFPDLMQYEFPDTLFTNHGKRPVISDSSIIFFEKYWVNGENVCCKPDTLELYSDRIHGKKYLFAIGDYIALFQSTDSLTVLRPRKPVSIPLWGIKLNTPYPADKFLNKYEKLGMDHVKIREEFDEVSRQTWAENDSILVETIQFNNSTDRIITSLYKDMDEQTVNTMIGYIKNNFQPVKVQETLQKDSEGKPMKVTRLDFQGVSMRFTQLGAREYSFQVTDYYETLKLILNNRQGYIFRDDVRIY